MVIIKKQNKTKQNHFNPEEEMWQLYNGNCIMTLEVFHTILLVKKIIPVTKKSAKRSTFFLVKLRTSVEYFGTISLIDISM
jgi:hypothetical protein